MMDSVLSARDFGQLSTLIYNELGIKMPESKNTMLTGRLCKRLRCLGLENFTQYCEFLYDPQGFNEEIIHLIDAVTTNKTDFFRESDHFNYLTNSALFSLQEESSFHSRAPFRIWSAGCSTGEEPYTMAMVLSEFKEKQPGFHFEILATDISTRVLDIARRGVYPIDRIEPVTYLYRKKYLLRGKASRNQEIRIAPEIRKLVQFGRLNFMATDFGLATPVDVIFCRNVMIYFDKETQEKLMHKFSRYLNPGGFLFLGHSESLHGYDTPFVQVAPTVYRKS